MMKILAVTKGQESEQMEGVEMKILWFSLDLAKLDKVLNEVIHKNQGRALRNMTKMLRASCKAQ